MAGSKSTKQTEIAGMAPAGLSGFNLKALDAFMQWTTRVQVPKNGGASTIIEKLMLHCKGSMPVIEVSVATIDEFMQWVEEAGQTCELDEVGREITVAFILYRTRLKNYRDRIRSYWVQ